MADKVGIILATQNEKTCLVVYHKDSTEISQIVRNLKNDGYKVGVDFDFEYSSGKWDSFTGKDIPRQTKFTFYNKKLATWMVLKYF